MVPKCILVTLGGSAGRRESRSWRTQGIMRQISTFDILAKETTGRLHAKIEMELSCLGGDCDFDIQLGFIPINQTLGRATNEQMRGCAREREL